MRNIPAAALAKINSQYGIEALIILQIQWPNGTVHYGDKEKPIEGVEGRILNAGNIDDVVGVGQSGSSRSVSFTLSDHDGTLKNYFDHVDLHKIPCRILQTFEGLGLGGAFVIFDGQINTPIQWNEGERTLEITVMSLLESREFGFSPDEAYFGIVGNSVMGQAFPIAFGTNIRLPALSINESPQIMLAQGFGIVDEEQWEEEIDDLAAQAQLAYQNARNAQAAETASSFIANTYRNGSEHSYIGLGGAVIVDDPPDDYQTYLQYKNQADQYGQQYVQFSNEYLKIQNEVAAKRKEFAAQKATAARAVAILSTNAPRGVPLVVQIGENRFNVVLNGAQMVINGIVQPPKPRKSAFATYGDNDQSRNWEGQKTRQKYQWVAGGTKLKVLNLPMKYVVSLNGVNILNVFGKQQGMYVPVPRDKYVTQFTPFITKTGQVVFATTITTTLPLTSIQDDAGNQVWEDDQIYVDLVSGIPGRMVDILIYAISTFTNLGYDPGSFATARMYTDAIPMNHVVQERRDTLEYCEAIAFQGKCALWVNDNRVYIRYLPVEPTPVDTITTNDILEDTLSIFTTDTEDVVTKYIALWKFSQDQPENNQIVFRYNMQKYNYQDESYTFFAFNDPGSVGWSARYWSVRKGTVYKKIKFKTDLTKMNLEAFDAVLVDIVPMVSCVPVVGIVESAVYDSDAKEIDFVVWLPVRLGELCPFAFGYPASENALYGDPADPGIYTGNPFEKMLDPTNFMTPTFNYYTSRSFGALSPLRGTPYYSEQGTDQPISVDTFIMNGVMNQADPAGIDLEKSNDYRKYEIKPLKDIPVADADANLTFFATTIGKPEGVDDIAMYRCQLYGSEKKVNARQAFVSEDSPRLPNGTPVIMIKVAGMYYFQAPIWVTPDEETP
jgi:hypothetical protein